MQAFSGEAAQFPQVPPEFSEPTDKIIPYSNINLFLKWYDHESMHFNPDRGHGAPIIFMAVKQAAAPLGVAVGKGEVGPTQDQADKWVKQDALAWYFKKGYFKDGDKLLDEIHYLIDNNNKDLTQFMNKVLLEYLKIYKVIQI